MARVGRDEDSEDFVAAVLDFVNEDPKRWEDGVLGGGPALGGVTGTLDLVLGRMPRGVMDEIPRVLG